MPQKLLLAAAAALVLAVSSCNSAPLASSNLDALMDADDNLRHLAPVQSTWRYFASALFDPKWFKDDSVLSARPNSKVGDPSYESLKYLLTLAEGGGVVRRSVIEIEQVRQFARYAARCPGRLARERALLELSAHARRLRVAQPVLAPERAANAPELSEALAGLVQAMGPMLTQGSSAGATERADLRAACDVLSELQFDIDGGWRLLRAIGGFAGLTNIDREVYAPLKALSESVQADLVALALAHGLRDDDVMVRAAAFEANHAAFGRRFLRDALLALRPPIAAPDGMVPVTPVFGLSPEHPDNEAVYVRVFELLRDNGLPLPALLSERDARTLRLELLVVAMSIIHEFRAFPERTRTAAMFALSEVSGSGFESLRKEDWEIWWLAHYSAEAAAIQALGSAAKAGT